jgi:chromosome segregation protein
LTEHRARREALAQLQARVRTSGRLGDWLEKHGLASLEPLWRHIEVDTGWERAAEAVLRERLAALTGAGAEHAATVLGDLPPGSLALAFSAESASGRLARPGPATRPFADLIRSADPAIAALLGDWLNGVFAVDSLAPWLDRRITLAAGYTLVDREGRSLSRNVLISHVPDDRTHGVIERQREIDALDARIEALQHEADAAHDAVSGCEQHAATLQEILNTVRRDAQTLQQQLHAAQVDLLKLVQAGERAAERRTQIGHDLAELERHESAEREHASRADAEHARCAELAAIQHERLQAALEVLTEREQALREIRTLAQSAARDEQEARFSQRECAAKQEEAARAAALAAEQIARIAAETGTHEETLAATDVSRCEMALQRALELRSTRETALAACRDAQEDAAARLRELEEQRLTCEHAAAPLREHIGELRLAVQAASLAAAQFDERLIEARADIDALHPLLSDELREAQLTREVARLAREIEELGPVNLAALDEVTAAEERRGYLDAQNDDLTEAIATLEDAIRRIDRETREQLRQTYDTVNRHFGEVFPQLFGGGQAALMMTGEEILDAGIQIVAQPPGKRNSSIHLLSGGEKALTAIALVFSMFQLNPAPFCMLDEVDAPLDDANTERYCNMVRRMSAQTQFVFISHSKITMEIAEQLVGVTMQEQGVSRVVEVDIEAALRLAEPAAA